ncbi:MAG TPA: peptidylprolyl isomerase [Bryobacteraceae bacterium]|nr:peptidylprolyl isomerase [Bryobacteraceae bacterium]
MKLDLLPLCACAALLLGPLTGCKRTPPANVAAMVNNRSITTTELEKTYNSQFPASQEGSSEDQVMMQKLELLRNMIDSEIMLQRAEKLGLLASDADVQTKLNEFKAPYTKEEFDRVLANRKMTLEDLKSQIRKELSIQKLINKEITSHITITDADVANFYTVNKASFNLAEPQIHMAQILVTPLPDPNVHNLKNSKAQNDTEAKQKIQDIAARLKQGEDFTMLAQNYSEDPNTAANGGDMGFIPESALEKANAELRKLVASLPPGGVSPVIHTQEGYRILKVISKEPAGQRELTDPRVQQNIRETLLNRKDQLLKAAYYEVARNEAKVANYFAKNVLDNASKTK